MLVHKGGKIKNLGVECRDVTPTKSLSQNNVGLGWVGGGGGGGGQGGCERRIEVFVKIKKKMGWGREGGGVGFGGGGQGGCHQRIEKFWAKFTKKNR